MQWIDQFARVRAARWIPSLATLAPVVDEASVLALEVELSRRRKDSPEQPFIDALLIHFEVMQGRFELEEAALLALTVAAKEGSVARVQPELDAVLRALR